MSHEILYADSRNQITVSVEGYRRIMALIEHYKVCHACEQSYTEYAPEVVRNSCVRCFLAHRRPIIVARSPSWERVICPGTAEKR